MSSKNRYKGKHWSSDFKQLPKKGSVWYLEYPHKAGKEGCPPSLFEVDSVVNEFHAELLRIAFWAPIEDHLNPPHFDRWAIEGLLWINENGTVKRARGDTDEFSFYGTIVHQGIKEEVCAPWKSMRKNAFTPITEEEFEAMKQKPKLKSWRDAELEYLGNEPDLVCVVPTENFVHYVISSEKKIPFKTLVMVFTPKNLSRFCYACAIQITEKYPKEEIDQETLDIAQS